MTAPLFIGIDVGSSSTKVGVYDQRFRELGAARVAYRPSQPRAGVAEYDPDELYASVLEAVRDATHREGVVPTQIEAICVDAMISGGMGIDAHWRPTVPYTTTLDTRFSAQLDRALLTNGREIRRLTGSGQPTIGPKIAWIRQTQPEAYARTAKFLTIGGYVVGKLASLSLEDALIDPTQLWASGLSDTAALRWSTDLCNSVDVSHDRLPRIVESATVVGGLGSEAAAATGLRTGIPVLAGMGDQSAGFLGAAIITPNDMADVAGTYPIIALCTDTFRPDLKRQAVEVVAAALPGRWYLLSLIVGGGLTTQWFQETFAHVERTDDLGRDGATAFDMLEEGAAALPAGSDRLLFVPHLGGQACPPRSNCRGMWIGFTWTHRREHFYRAVLEAVAYDQYLAFESMRIAYPDINPRDILVYGGGSHSRLWNQIKADVMGVPYVRSARDEVATLGCALLAAYATGAIPDLGSAATAISIREERYEPSARLHEVYAEYAHLYADLLQGTDRYYTRLAGLPSESRHQADALDGG